MDATQFIQQAYWSGWLKGLLSGAILGAVAVWACFRWTEIKLAWRMMRK